MDKRTKKLSIIFLSFFAIFFIIAGFFVFTSNYVSADANNMLWGGSEGNVQSSTGLGSTDIRIVIANIIRIALGFLGIIAVALLLYGGWLWMSSAGDSQKIDQAKKVITGAVIGLIIILMSFAIASFIINRLYQATGAAGSPICDASNLGTCSGCQLCVFDTAYHWQFSAGCGAGCNLGPGAGAIYCDGNTMTPTCDVDNTICDGAYGIGTHYCDFGTCICKPLGGYGDPCDANLVLPTCESDDGLCLPELYCDTTSCLCLGGPVIDWISPVNVSNQPFGAPGNIITIAGRFFGTSTGQVLFWDGSDFTIPAPFPNSVNPSCTDFWTDTQVIVLVPAGAVNGPIRINRADSEADETNNTRGPSIPDFNITTQPMPGVCQLNPNNGLMGDSITYYGMNLSGAIANFGSVSSFVAAQSSSFPGNLQGTAVVPNVMAGQTTTFASTSVGLSNALYFTVAAGTPPGPTIISFDPVAGPPGQYVTISGSGFGSSRGTSKVFFGNQTTGIEAKYDFPDVCADSVWTDNQVIVKVPTAANGFYVLTMELGSVVIDTAALTPDRFDINNSLPLPPGLCKIQPIMGPVDSEVKMWGEYFGVFNVADSKIRFHLNNDQSGSLAPTGPLIAWGPDGKADKAEAVVHTNAATGPVRVIKAGPAISNGLNFKVGICKQNNECGTGNFCCQPGTFAAGRCVTNEDDCFSQILNSVFEWDFSTALNTGGLGTPCDGDTTTSGCQASSTMCSVGYECNISTCLCQPVGLEACSGLGLSQCLTLEFCPNSSGQCSTYVGGAPKTVGTCPYDCSGIGLCTPLTCAYNNTFDLCFVNGSVCDANKIVQDITNKNVTAYCAFYQGVGRWHFDSSKSCPVPWTKIAGNKCVDITTLCGSCDSGQTCLAGSCAVKKDICLEGSICNVSNQCVLNDQAKCECCCEIGQDARDCCMPLKCEGTCGSDTTNDSVGLGKCTGCANAGTTQADHDAACNCSNSAGKYCDATVPGGVCRDCAEITDPITCQQHSSATTCCIDNKASNQCRGNKNGVLLTGGLCAYFDCQAAPNNNLCDNTPLPTGQYNNLAVCTSGCSMNNIGSGLGLSCASTATSTCNTGICALPFGCLNADGSGPTYPSTCGFCCCDPSNDQCGMLNPAAPYLKCQPDVAPCSSPTNQRGMCCGCTANADCGNINAVGCGMDACCRARPSVISNIPADYDDKVCRNALISATFNELMDVQSFTGNIIVAADYGLNNCPAGTEYIAMSGRSQEKNILARAVYSAVEAIRQWWRMVLPTETARAYTVPVANHNYCAIKGTVSGYNNTLNQSVLEFKSSNILDANRLYYVIIKGDNNLSASTSVGVLSNWGIGMNGAAASNNTFNGLSYNNSHIWSFTTLPEQGDAKGVCQLHHVNIQPASYLFQTTANDNNENDINPSNKNFDTVTDADKVFVAYPRSQNNQILVPQTDYGWSWNWISSNSSIADKVPGPLPFPLDSNKQLIRTGTNITDGKTILTAQAIINADNIFSPSSFGTIYAGKADVFVFICANPWPPVVSGTWSPWRDNDTNCTIVDAGCFNTNYEVYYCRDAGNFGSYDDLPAILSGQGNSVIRGKSNVNNILKEVYYLREANPQGASLLNLAAVPTGGSVQAAWTAIPDPLITGYKLYWSKTSGTAYSDSADVGNVTAYQVDNLTNNKKYYFNLTSYYKTGAESKFYGEMYITPADSLPPVMPLGFTASSSAGQVELNWGAVSDATSYEIMYGTSAGVYAQKKNIGNDLGVIIDKLTLGQTYYFGVVALDAAGNRSATGTDSVVVN